MTQHLSAIKYSIIIPTRNREKYLPYAVESVLSVKRTDVELIVSNNHSSDGTASYLSKLNDVRLKLISPSDALPMALHYEFALSHAIGDWVTILGDDDSIMPYLFERLDLIIPRYPKISIISSARAYYFWEGCEDLYGNKVVEYLRNSKQSLRSTKNDLLSALAGLRSCFDLPQIYTTCIVKRSLIEHIKKQSGGKFYHSIIPDIYSAVSLSLMEEHYLRVEEPLFWVGTSSGSMGRSDRIYIDSELQRGTSTDKHPQLRLHANIPQKLHILGFGSVYLYEALLNCPLANRSWKTHTIAILVYADVCAKIKKLSVKRGFNKDLLEKYAHEQIVAYSLSPMKVKFTSTAIAALRIIQQILRIPKSFTRKIHKLIGKDTLISTDRKKFNTIQKASAAVETILKKH